jgi:hypothetical protein
VVSINPLAVRAGFGLLLVAGMLVVPFYSIPASALIPGQMTIGLADHEDTVDDCDPVTSTASSTKGGVSFTFIVPSTVSDVEASNNPEEAVNIHASFWGEDGNYYEVGMYYGDWTADGASGYDPDEFQFAYGVDGELQKALNLPVVEGHEVELSFVYLNSQGQWVVFYDDLDDGTSIQSVNAGHANVDVKSDYTLFIETNSAFPHDNSETFGLVEVTDVEKATRIPNDGVSFSNWSAGFLLGDDCAAIGTEDFGVTYLGSVGHFEIGFGGDVTGEDHGHQFW